jgi:hypothetical protein
VLARLPVAALAQLASTPQAVAAATCSDYPNHAAAQRAADTRDPDRDGIYCESLPCRCCSAAGGGGGGTPPSPTRHGSAAAPVRRRAVDLFSSTKYPNIRAHLRAALRRGWPRTLGVNRSRADARRDQLLRNTPTRSGFVTARSIRQRSVAVAARTLYAAGARAGGRRRAERRDLGERIARLLARGKLRRFCTAPSSALSSSESQP